MMLRFITARICKSGTVVVQKKGGDFDTGEELGDVLLVKGIGSQVGEGIPPSQLPLLARTTFLPLYDMLVYDGLMVMNNRPISLTLQARIKVHVEKAIREETVVYCGESARKGLWDEAPPELLGGSKKGKDEDDDDREEEDDVAYEPTPAQLKMAEKIVRFAKSHGYKGRSN